MRFTTIIFLCLLLPITVIGQSVKKINFRLNAGVSWNQGPITLANHMKDNNFDKTSPGSNSIIVTSPTEYPISHPFGFCLGFEFSKLFNGYGVGAGLGYAYNGSSTGRAESVYLNQGVEMTAAHYLSIKMTSLSFELFYETRRDRAINFALGPLVNYQRFSSVELNYSLSLGLKGELVGRPFWKGMGLNLGGVLFANAQIEEFTSYNSLPWVQDIILPKGRINLSYIYAGMYYDL